MFAQFTELVADASGWAYAIVLLFAFLDALVPVVPSETAVITAGVVAASGQLELPLVIAAAAGGACLGDNAAYAVGRRYGARVQRRFSSTGKGRERVEWAQRQLRERGGQMIVTGRFVPGGRTAVTLSAGMLRFAWRRFLPFDAVASLSWALFASFLGYFGGHAFEKSSGKGLVLAIALGLALGGGIELGRWALRRRRRG